MEIFLCLNLFAQVPPGAEAAAEGGVWSEPAPQEEETDVRCEQAA